MEIPSGQFPDSGKYQGKKEYGWYPEKKWLILAFLNKKALCKSVASWSSGKAGKAGAILLVFALQKPFALPQEASHSGNKHSGRIILLSEIPDLIFPRRFFSNTCRTARYPDAGYWVARAWDAPSNG